MGNVNFRKHNPGFSSIGVLCALGIMLILFIVFFRTYVYRDNDIKYQIAREELSLLNCALEYYRTSCGEYPPGNQPSIDQNAASMYDTLAKISKNFLAGHDWKLSSNRILDPWGHPYIYKCSGKPDDSYILFSMGPNGYIDERELIDDIYSR
jgi:type II secretory pathway pseudopilin PulG